MLRKLCSSSSSDSVSNNDSNSNGNSSNANARSRSEEKREPISTLHTHKLPYTHTYLHEHSHRHGRASVAPLLQNKKEFTKLRTWERALQTYNNYSARAHTHSPRRVGLKATSSLTATAQPAALTALAARSIELEQQSAHCCWLRLKAFARRSPLAAPPLSRHYMLRDNGTCYSASICMATVRRVSVAKVEGARAGGGNRS